MRAVRVEHGDVGDFRQISRVEAAYRAGADYENALMFSHRMRCRIVYSSRPMLSPLCGVGPRNRIKQTIVYRALRSREDSDDAESCVERRSVRCCDALHPWRSEALPSGRGWIASLPSGPRRRHPDAPSRHAEGKPLSSRTNGVFRAPETCARTGADRRTDFAAKRIEIVRTEHDCGSFHRFSFHTAKEICARLSKKCETKKGGRDSRDAGSRLTSRTLPRWPSPLAGRNSAKRPKRY